MIYYEKSDLQDALFEALDSNSSASDYVKRFAENVGKVIAKTPKHYRYFGPYWWPLKAIMIKLGVPGIDDFIDAEGLSKVNLAGDEYICVAAWSMQDSRIEAMELPHNTVIMEDAEGNFEECVTIDPFLEEKIKIG